jgi:sugar lactone lactonase YvrE
MGLPPLPEGAVVVAEGLWNPSGLAFGEDGTLYIAEQGFVATPSEEPAPSTTKEELKEGSPLQVVIPGQISAIAADGTWSVLAGDIPGATALTVHGDHIYTISGGMSIGAGFVQLESENAVTSVEIATGAKAVVANLGMFEYDNNPDGTDINPNLYGIAADADGLLYVADAGGNTLYTVDAASGEIALFAVVPTLEELLGASPVPIEAARQSVPTSLVIDANGVIHVTLLSFGWNGPSILAYTPDGAWTGGAGPLSSVVGSAIGPDGLLYVVQLSDNFMSEEPTPGSVIRVNADGTTEVVIGGLFFPHGIAFDTAGTLFVTVNSIISGPDAPMGQVIKFESIAAAM